MQPLTGDSVKFEEERGKGRRRMKPKEKKRRARKEKQGEEERRREREKGRKDLTLARAPGTRVLSAFPLSVGLTRPVMGTHGDDTRGAWPWD